MRKLSIVLIVVVLSFTLVSCLSTENAKSSSHDTPVSNDVEVTPSESEQISSETPKIKQDETSADIHQLEAGDDVAIVGQVASSKLVNGNTLWVQVQQKDATFVIYHCQLKDNFITRAEEFKMLDVAKVNGLFLNLMDLKQENTSPLVTLYDCEIEE